MSSQTSKPRCPRCGGVISWIESQRKGGRVYYVAVHYLGRVGGKRMVKKCYLGPEEYVYVSRTHQDLDITLEGLIRDRRLINYLDAFISSLFTIDLDEKTLIEVTRRLRNLVERLERYVREIER